MNNAIKKCRIVSPLTHKYTPCLVQTLPSQRQWDKLCLSWSESFKCLSVEFIHSVFVRAKPQVTIVVFINRENSYVFCPVFHRIMDNILPVITPYSVSVGSDPKLVIIVFGNR